MSRLWFAGKIDKFRLMAKFDFRTSAKLWGGVSNMFSMTTLLHGWHAQIKLSWDTIPVSRQSQWLEKPLEKVQLCCAPQLSISKCTENINVWQIRTKPDWSPCLLGRCIFNGAGPWYQVLPRGIKCHSSRFFTLSWLHGQCWNVSFQTHHVPTRHTTQPFCRQKIFGSFMWFFVLVVLSWHPEAHWRVYPCAHSCMDIWRTVSFLTLVKECN